MLEPDPLVVAVALERCRHRSSRSPSRPNASPPVPPRVELRPGLGLDRRPAGRGARACSLSGASPPRFEALEHPDHRRWHADAPRLQPRRRDHDSSDEGRPGDDRRDPAVYGPRTPRRLQPRGERPRRESSSTNGPTSMPSGLILFEMIAGQHPFPEPATRPPPDRESSGLMTEERRGPGPVAQGLQPGESPRGLDAIVRPGDQPRPRPPPRPGRRPGRGSPPVPRRPPVEVHPRAQPDRANAAKWARRNPKITGGHAGRRSSRSP